MSSPRYRKSIHLRDHEAEVEVGDEDGVHVENGEDDLSEVGNASVMSSITDKYGFMNGRGGDDADFVSEKPVELSIEKQRKRELKWLHMLNNWEHFMSTNYSKVRSRCRKGIPSSVRASAWLHLCGAQLHIQRPESRVQFQKYYKEQGNQKFIEDIEKDLHRNFPTHELFGGIYEQIGQKELYRCLKAYSVYNPEDGYCQAMAPLTALLLMNMPADQAFWCMVAVCDRYIPGYYSPGMEAIQLDGEILFGLLKKSSPSIYRHLKKQGVDPLLFMTEWFLCVFARTLPWPSVMRIWDMFMCEGVKVLFRVALVLIKFSLPKSVLKSCPTMYETLEVLKHLPPAVTREDFLVEQVLKVSITEKDMEKEHRKQIRLRRKNK